MSAGQPPVLVERSGDVGTISINRPEKRNAINHAVSEHFLSALATLGTAKVIIVTGQGEIAFSAGMDLAERSTADWRNALGSGGAEHWAAVIAAIRRHSAVFIAAVNGVAVGGGLTLVNTCELAIASRTATFGIPEMGFGSFPALSGPSTIRRLLPKHAAGLIFRPSRVDAQRAWQCGLVNEVVAPEDLSARSQQVAAEVAAIDARVLGLGKRAVQEMELMDWQRAIEHGTLISTMVREYTQRSTENDSPAE